MKRCSAKIKPHNITTRKLIAINPWLLMPINLIGLAVLILRYAIAAPNGFSRSISKFGPVSGKLRTDPVKVPWFDPPTRVTFTHPNEFLFKV